MDFYQALLGKPRHLWGGDWIDDAGASISNGWKGLTHPNTFNPDIQQNTFSPDMPTNTFTAKMPINAFKAAAPVIDRMNFQPGMDAGMAGYNAGAAGLGGTFGAQSDLAGQAGQSVGALQGLYGQQQGLADALLAQSRGQGPNPVQLQLKQNMDQAITQQASALASTRGINPALAARMAAQQGGAMQQQAAGQAAVLGAQQQLAAQQALGQQQQAMGSNILGQNSIYGTQGNLYGQAAGTAGALGSLGAGMYGANMQGQNAQNALINQGSLGAQGINAGVAEQNANLAAHGQDIAAATAQQNANLAAQGEALKAGVASGNQQANIAGQQIKSGVAGSNAQAQTAIVGGLIGAAGGAAAAGLAKGGQPAAASPGVAVADNSAGGGGVQYANYAAHGGQVHDQKALALAHALMGQGGAVPGKAKKKGDAAENDTVPTVLSPKEIVLPRSVTMAEDAPEKAAEFVAKLKSKSGGVKGYGKVLEKHRVVKKHLDELESMIKRSAG